MLPILPSQTFDSNRLCQGLKGTFNSPALMSLEVSVETLNIHLDAEMPCLNSFNQFGHSGKRHQLRLFTKL